MIEKLDSLDISILNSLSIDARTPFTEIAKDLNVSSGTIHVRIRKMETMGIITTSRLNINYRALNIEVIAYVFLRMRPQASLNEIVGDLKKIPELISAEVTTGSNQVIAKLICASRHRYNEIITSVFPSIDGIAIDQHTLVLDELIDRPLILLEPMVKVEEA
ncbi:MAG TPA: AsnC family transcriptional regulator [Saprospiraceae bacterium]|nr:AsnC family transcriptional regulator [Saprospiraceae bacterium]